MGSARPLRQDAQRNRERALDSARALFAEHGLAISHHDIARHSGLGVGTVYRRFPDRQSLVEAVYADQVRELVEHCRAANEIDDPWEALVELLERYCQRLVNTRGLRAVMFGPPGESSVVPQAREALTPIVEPIIARAREAGQIRPDVEVSDIPFIVLSVGVIAEATAGHGDVIWRRHLVLLLNGLRNLDGEALPGPALQGDAIDAAVERFRR